MNSWLRSACYPRRTFYPLSDGPSMQNHRITKAYFRTCSTCWSRSQPRLYFCIQRLISKHAERSFARLRYRLGGDRPSQTTRHSMSFSRVIEIRRNHRSRRVVSHRWLLQARKPGLKASHLSCAARAIVHTKGIVKVHGVFPSSCGQPASSPALQVRRVSRQDSRTFVTPFVQVGTYPTRNFAQFVSLCFQRSWTLSFTSCVHRLCHGSNSRDAITFQVFFLRYQLQDLSEFCKINPLL